MENSRQIALDDFERPTLTVDQAIDLMLCGGRLSDTLFEESDDVSLFNQYKNILKNPLTLNADKDGYVSVDQYHQVHSTMWMVPQNYMGLNVWEYVLQLCKTEEELIRVEQELLLFEERNMFDLIRLLVYLVDHFRQNDYVWGVGRGSSVASYCLYLIGVHKVDSMKYKLDIGEFLK